MYNKIQIKGNNKMTSAYMHLYWTRYIQCRTPPFSNRR